MYAQITNFNVINYSNIFNIHSICLINLIILKLGISLYLMISTFQYCVYLVKILYHYYIITIHGII